jgi:hypothetical protein
MAFRVSGPRPHVRFPTQELEPINEQRKGRGRVSCCRESATAVMLAFGKAFFVDARLARTPLATLPAMPGGFSLPWRCSRIKSAHEGAGSRT